MEDLIRVEVDEFMDMIKSKSDNGESIDLNKRFNLAVVNSLWAIMAGTRLSQNDEKLMEIQDAGNKYINKDEHISIIKIFNISKYRRMLDVGFN